MGSARPSRATNAGQSPALVRYTNGVVNYRGHTFYRFDKYRLLNTSQNASPAAARVQICSKYLQKTGALRNTHMTVNRRANGSSFSGLVVCGNVHQCPVCSQKIAKRHKDQVLAALAAHRTNGGVSLMVTRTFAHGRNDELKTMLERQSKAERYFKQSAVFRRMKKEIGMIGTTKVREITHGQANGWHPHTHEIWYLKAAISSDQAERLQAELFKTWQKACIRYELGKPNEEHGLRVDYRPDDTGSIGSYITKWADEITGSINKGRSKIGGRNQWQILRDIHIDNKDSDVALWQEYCIATHGMMVITWSQGLKKLLGIDDLTEQDMAEEDESGVILESTSLNADQWWAVVKLEKRADVLEIMTSCGATAVQNYVNTLLRRCREIDPAWADRPGGLGDIQL